MFEIEKINKKGYGYELDNPIRVNQIPGTHEYITSLKHKNGILVNYKRAFAEYCEETKHMVDIYYVYILSTGETPKLLKYTMFFDMYYFHNDKEIPEDFE